MNMDENNFNNRIIIQKRVTTKVKGIPTDTWINYYTCWCSIDSLFGQEAYKAIEINLENTLNFTVRYTKILDALNTKEYQILWGTRQFKVISTDYFNYDKQKISIKAKEVI